MKIKLIIVSLLLFMNVKGYTQDLNIEQRFQNELKLKNEQVVSIKCRFIQVQKISVLNNVINKKGNFYFLKPSNMLLSFSDGDFIKMNDKWFEMKTGANVTTTKITSNPMLKNLSSILSACVAGDFDKMSSGFFAEFEEKQNKWIVTLSPKKGKMASKISRIVIHFDKTDMSIDLLKMEEKTGDYTEYSFTDKQFNIGVDSELFKISK